MKNYIISFVGQRAIAVIMPIKTLFEQKNIHPADCKITLIHTPHTKRIAERCQKWLNEKYCGSLVDIREFSREKTLPNNISDGDIQIYFNVNAGMNWQIAYLCIILPEHTKCVASDTEYCYIWDLMDDVKNAEQFELLDIGLESYIELSENIIVKSCAMFKGSLHQSILNNNDTVKNTSFNIQFRGNKPIPIEYLNQRLIWVNERKGMLHIFFDFLSRPADKKITVKTKKPLKTITDIDLPLQSSIQ